VFSEEEKNPVVETPQEYGYAVEL